MTAANKLAVHHSSARADWRTPEAVLQCVRQVGAIALDPCASRDGSVGSSVELYGDGLQGVFDDGLKMDWQSIVSRAGGGIVYVNPPYGRGITPWIEACRRWGDEGLDIIALLPARTDTHWWHDNVWTARAVCFWRGRITFVGASHPAPFPSALALWTQSRMTAARFVDAFEGVGQAVIL